jgi:ferredoxin-thioredoxin reductase catalytic subunit
MRLNPNQSRVDLIRYAVKVNNGHCPCMIERTEDTKCPCKKFREEKECCCELYVRKEVVNEN